MNKRTENTDKSTSLQQFPIFSPELSKMKRSVTLLSSETKWIDFKTASSLNVWQIQLQIVLEALFIFNMIYIHGICFQTRGSLFFLSYSRHQQHTEEALWIQVTGSAF